MRPEDVPRYRVGYCFSREYIGTKRGMRLHGGYYAIDMMRGEAKLCDHRHREPETALECGRKVIAKRSDLVEW